MLKLASIFVLLSVADLIITIALVGTGVGYGFDVRTFESNPLAKLILWYTGVEGLIVYKLLLVSLIVTFVDTLNKNNHKRHPFYSKYFKPEYIMLFGIILTGAAVILGIFCFVGV